MKLDVFVVAHADDWQLFMMPEAHISIVDQHSKTIFIVVTAGDAGIGKGYWTAREEGMLSSIRACLSPLCELNENKSSLKFFNNNISFYRINNTTSFFLRLPDGSLDGNGFATNDYASLKNMIEEQKPLKSVDGSNYFTTKSDIAHCIEYIISTESNGDIEITLHYHQPDMNKNPNDHADHTAVGYLIETFINSPGIQHIKYSGYNPPEINYLSPTECFWKTNMFAAYEKAVFDLCGYSTLAENVALYQEWCKRRSYSMTL